MGAQSSTKSYRAIASEIEAIARHGTVPAVLAWATIAISPVAGANENVAVFPREFISIASAKIIIASDSATFSQSIFARF